MVAAELCGEQPVAVKCGGVQPLQGARQRKLPKKHPAHARFPAASLPQSAGPGFILKSLFPLRMGTHPCRRPGAWPILGASVHCGKSKSLASLSSWLWGPPGEPLLVGRQRG